MKLEPLPFHSSRRYYEMGRALGNQEDEPTASGEPRSMPAQSANPSGAEKDGVYVTLTIEIDKGSS